MFYIYIYILIKKIKMHISAGSISVQRISRREFRMDKKLYGLIADDEFVLLVAPSLKRQTCKSLGFWSSTGIRNILYSQHGMSAISETDS